MSKEMTIEQKAQSLIGKVMRITTSGYAHLTFRIKEARKTVIGDDILFLAGDTKRGEYEYVTYSDVEELASTGKVVKVSAWQDFTAISTWEILDDAEAVTE